MSLSPDPANGNTGDQPPPGADEHEIDQLTDGMMNGDMTSVDTDEQLLSDSDTAMPTATPSTIIFNDTSLQYNAGVAGDDDDDDGGNSSGSDNDEHDDIPDDKDMNNTYDDNSTDHLPTTNNIDDLPQPSDPSVPMVDVSETLPIFANEANQQLNTTVNLKGTQLNKLTQQNTDLTDRITVIQSHIKNIRNEEKYTQSLLTSKLTDITAEQHLAQLSQRTLESYTHELTFLSQQCKQVKQNIQTISSNMYATADAIEQCKQAIQAKEGELVKWNVIEKQKMSDIDQLSVFGAEDTATLKQLTAKSEHLNAQLSEQKAMLTELELKTKLVQVELNTCATEYSNAHQSKTMLITNYNRAVQQLRDIEYSIGSQTQASNTKQLRIEALKQKVRDAQNELTNAMNTNKRAQFNITVSEANLHKAKQTHADRLADNRTLTSDIQFVRYSERQLKTQLRQVKQEVQSLDKQCAIERERCERLLEEKHAKQIELEAEQANSSTKQVKQNDKAELYEASVQQLKQHNKKVDVVKKQLVAVQQQLFDSKHSEQVMINEIQSIESMLKANNAQKQVLQTQINKQTEVLYNVTYNLHQQKSKLQSATQEVSYEAKHRLEQRVKALNDQLVQERQTLALLAANYKKLQNSWVQYTKQLNDLSSKNSEVNELMTEINLICANIQVQNGRLTAHKNGVLLIYNNLKLSLVKQKDVLYKSKVSLLSEQQQREQLTQQYKQRLYDIQAHLDIQKNQIKLASENRSELTTEVTERKNKINKLKLKYESIAIKLAKKFDSDGFLTNTNTEEKNQAHYIIHVAQQREAMIRQGDALHQQIQQAEAELHALHNTAQLIGSRNAQYKADQVVVDSGAPEVGEKHRLENNLRNCLDALYKNRAYQRDLVQQHADKTQSSRYTTQQIQQLRQQVEQLEGSVGSLNKGITDQTASVNRATVQYNARMQRYKSTVSSEQYNTMQRYRTVCEKKARYKLIVGMLRDYMESKPELLQLQFNTSELIDILRPLTSSTQASSRPSTSRSLHSSASTTPSLPPINGGLSRPSSNKSIASNSSQMRVSVNTLRIG